MFAVTKAELALEGLQPDLTAMRTELIAAQEIQDPLDKIMALFTATSPRHDRERTERPLASAVALMTNAGPDANFAGTIVSLSLLKTHISRTGREPFGINRTEPGQDVTPDHVFLGGLEDYGIYTWPISRWKDEIEHGLGEREKTCVFGLATSFVNSHIPPMIELLDKLTAISPDRSMFAAPRRFLASRL